MKKHERPGGAWIAAILLGVVLGSPGDAGAAAGPVCAHHIDVTELTISKIQKAYRNRHYTAEALTQAYLDRIEQYEPSYNAFTFLNPSALDEARAIDRKRRNGEPLGPLAGIPVVVKESMDVVGLPSTAGWAPLSAEAGGVDLFPIENAVVVERLIRAGAIILGKTNIPAFSDDGTRANSSWAGPTYNAVDRDLAPGASSSGTATAVAASFAVLGLAEETGGSIQNPAAAQSLVGVKPTFALVPTAGIVPLAGSTRDVAGPIAKTVLDAALVMDVLAGYSPEDPKTSASDGRLPPHGYTSELSKNALRRKRIGLYGPGFRSSALSPETEDLYARAVLELERQGATVVDDPFAGSGFAELALPGEPYDMRGTESLAHDFQRYLAGLTFDGGVVGSIDELSLIAGISPFQEDGGPLFWYVEKLPVLADSLLHPEAPPDLSSFWALRGQYLSLFDAVMAEHDLDALAFPQTYEVIPELFSADTYAATTESAINIAGLPGVVVPAGQYENGAPFGLIFVGPLWSEPRLLGYAYDYEQATRHRIEPELTP
ncbi:amidase [Sorangium cellulosum]|uniref:Amidase n=1 Tax=Sorangium cellulosum TaxID=56 RepID=A0A150PEE8_SORCE|nr:amidase [Sorangium cellulosum]KYF54073.1 amidase [Sorangium cellulosum]